ncbi:MAG: sigma-70 family RNA polymerase sigma factor [Clostridia bacterium]|nr:sigma-70 family RNA polymerase sigma factor [Clostridia bacterium]
MQHHEDYILDLYFLRDERAVTETQREYGSFCLDLALRILGRSNREDAEECVNDAYLALWRSIPPKRPKPLKAYLAAVLRNLAIDRYRKNRRRANMRELEEAALELSPAIWVPDSAEEELKHLLSDFLRGLPENERNLFMGRYWHGYSVKLLAKHYELTPNAVTKRLGGTREKLRGYLNERGYRIEE